MNLRTNYTLSVLSIALVLFSFGLYVMIILQSDLFINYIKERIDLIVELDSAASEEDRNAVRVFLDSSEYVIENSVDYMNSEEVLEDMKSVFDSDLAVENMGIPLSEMITFRIAHSAYNEEKLEAIKNEIETFASVQSMFYQSGLFTEIKKNFEKVKYGLIFLGIALFLIALALISGTLKLSLFSERKKIKSMELIGANPAFVRAPFIKRAFFHGLISGLLAVGMLYSLLYLAREYFAPIADVMHSRNSIYLFSALIILGIIVNIIITRLLLSQYLQMSLEDMY